MHCHEATCHTLPARIKNRGSGVGDLTVFDLWGPAQTTGVGGEKYFVTFTDGKSC